MTQFTNREFADKLANILKDFGLKNITIIDVSERNTLTDYFVLGTARNPSNAKASAAHGIVKREYFFCVAEICFSEYYVFHHFKTCFIIHNCVRLGRAFSMSKSGLRFML